VQHYWPSKQLKTNKLPFNAVIPDKRKHDQECLPPLCHS